MESELASLVRRHGGEPVSVPALREVERDFGSELARAMDAMRDGGVVVLTTGVGLARVLRVARAMGRGDALRDLLTRCTVVCRGPKPVAVLKGEGLHAHVRAQPPHTTTELLGALAGVDVGHRPVMLVHDGGGNRSIADALSARGGLVCEVAPYAWALPDDLSGLSALIGELVSGSIAALVITTQVQARHLFQVAESLGSANALKAALRDRVIVAAVGPTSARTLEELGVPTHVTPPAAGVKMGPLVAALAKRLDER